MNMRTSLLSVAALSCLVTAGCFPPAGPGSNSGPDNLNAGRPTPAPTPATKVKITAPREGDTIDMSYIVRGTSRGLPAGERLWVVVFVHDVRRYYPQNDAAAVQPDGKWYSPASFGIPTDKGLKFDALAVTVNAAAEAAFRDYLKTATDRKDFPGIGQLPPGTTQHDGVTVTRK